MNKLLTKIIIWVSGLIGWIPYHFSKEIQSFWDYDAYYIGSYKGLAIGRSLWHQDQAMETMVWIGSYILFASHIDGFGVIEYLTLFDRDIYQNI